MYIIRNTSELIKELNRHSLFIEAIFDSTNKQMDLSNALSRVSEEILEYLENIGFIEIYKNIVMLDEKVSTFLESMLVDGYDNDLSDYDEIFKKFKNHIELYYIAVESNAETSRHINAIHRILKKMPNNLMSTLDGLRKQVEFTYKSTQKVEVKLQELSSYKESLYKLDTTVDKITHNLMLQNSFFKNISDTAIIIQYIRLKDYLQRINSSLLQITQEVVTYITKVEHNARFYQHISNLKELISRKDFTDNSNIIEITSNTKTVLASGFNLVMKKNRNIKYNPELAYDDVFVGQIVGASKELEINNTPKISNAIENEMFTYEEDEEHSYIFALFDYLESKSECTFLEYLRGWDASLNENELLSVYLELITSDNDGLKFTGEDEYINGYLCATMKREIYGSSNKNDY